MAIGLADLDLLLFWEQVWAFTFRGMRDGQSRVVVAEPTVRMLVRGKNDVGEKDLRVVASDGGNVALHSRYGTTPQEVREWGKQTEEAEHDFDLRVGSGPEQVQRELPAERTLFDALLRASSPTAVRRVCQQSQIWLKYRWEYSDGQFQESPWPCPRKLYEDAEEFCKGKLHPRYPALDKRPSGDYKRIRHLARVMAGRSLRKPIKPSYAIELFRKNKLLRSAGGSESGKETR